MTDGLDDFDIIPDEEIVRRERVATKKTTKRKTNRAASDTGDAKPLLLIENCDPQRTVAALRDTLSMAEGLYDRGVPVRLAFDQIKQGIVAQVMTPDALVLMSHTVCRPYIMKASGGTFSEENARLTTVICRHVP